MKHVKEVTRITGYIFGIGSILFAFLAGGNSWLQNIFIGLIIGFLAGIILGGIAYFIMQWLDTSFLSHVVIIVSLVICSLVLGYIIFYGVFHLPLGKWSRIIPPPETPVEIIGDTPSWGYPVIYIRTEESSIFSYTCDYKNLCAWDKIDQVPDEEEVDHTGVLDSEPPFLVPPFLFGKVLSEHENSLDNPEAEFQYKFIITESGKIWEWSREFDGLSIIFAFFVWIFMGLGSGIIGYSSFVLRKNKDT